MPFGVFAISTRARRGRGVQSSLAWSRATSAQDEGRSVVPGRQGFIDVPTPAPILPLGKRPTRKLSKTSRLARLYPPAAGYYKPQKVQRIGVGLTLRAEAQDSLRSLS